MSTIHTDVATEFQDGENAEDAFAKLWGVDAEEPSTDTDAEEDEKPGKPAKDDNADNDDDAEDGDEGSEETPETDEDEDGDEGDDENGEQSTIEIKDDHKFKVPVDGEEREFSLGQLKRLAGQEAALTRKSQEVATTRKTLEDQSA